MAYNYGNYYPTPMGNFSPQYSQTPMNNMQMNNMQMQPQRQLLKLTLSLQEIQSYLWTVRHLFST